MAFEQSICHNLLTGIDFSNTNTIHCFLPAASKNEINTWLIIEALRSQYPHIQFVVPVSDLTNGTMISVLLEKDTLIKENKWGIPEPVNATIVDHAKINLVLIPLLVVDIHGKRVGYCEGFYDKFLLSCHPTTVKIGLSYFYPVDLIEDISDTDIPLDLTISPFQIHKH